MKRTFLTFLFIIYASSANAFSIDEIYRDVVLETDKGYMPLNTKTTSNLPIEISDEDAKAEKENSEEYLSFINAKKEAKIKQEKIDARWKETIRRVEKNQITPVDLETIENNVRNNHPQATEIYAWMHTKGIGVKKDLIKAFKLYKKAETLKVENSAENANKVYKVMSRKQKETIIYEGIGL